VKLAKSEKVIWVKTYFFSVSDHHILVECAFPKTIYFLISTTSDSSSFLKFKIFVKIVLKKSHWRILCASKCAHLANISKPFVLLSWSWSFPIPTYCCEILPCQTLSLLRTSSAPRAASSENDLDGYSYSSYLETLPQSLAWVWWPRPVDTAYRYFLHLNCHRHILKMVYVRLLYFIKNKTV